MEHDREEESHVNPYQPPAAPMRRSQGRWLSRDLVVLSGSFVIMTALGCRFLFNYWSHEGSLSTGMIRIAVFAAVMAAVHFVGYSLLNQQQASARKRGSGPQAPPSMWTRTVPRGLFWVIVFSLLFFLFSLLLL